MGCVMLASHHHHITGCLKNFFKKFHGPPHTLTKFSKKSPWIISSMLVACHTTIGIGTLMCAPRCAKELVGNFQGWNGGGGDGFSPMVSRGVLDMVGCGQLAWLVTAENGWLGR